MNKVCARWVSRVLTADCGVPSCEIGTSREEILQHRGT